MSEKFKYHYDFNGTHNIATIYENDMIICKDILIDEETLHKIIDKLNKQDRTINELLLSAKQDNKLLDASIETGVRQSKMLLNLYDKIEMLEKRLND